MNRLKQKILFALLLLVSVGVGRAWGAELHANLASSYIGGNVTSYEKQNDGSYKLTWKAASENVNVTYFESLCPKQGDDLSAYAGIRLKVSDYTKPFKLIVKAAGTSYTIGMYNTNTVGSVAGYKEFSFSDETRFKDINLKNVQDICIAGNDGTGGSIVIEDIYLYKTDNYTITLSNLDGGDNSLSKMTYNGIDYTATGTNTATLTASGTSIPVTLTETPADGYLFWEWQTSTDGGSNWTDTWNASSTYTVTANESANLNIRAQFTKGITVGAGIYGNGTVSLALKNGSDYNTCDNPIWLTPWKDFRFTATPGKGETFVGWYSGETCVNTNNPYDTQVQGSDYYLTAVFSNNAINETRTITSSSTTREYWLYVPVSIKNNTSTAVPVVFSLHGGNCDYNPSNEGVQYFNDLADKYGFIVVYPRAIEQKLPKFNGGNECRCWNATGTENADMIFLRDILTELKSNKTEFKVDESRVYITGFSNGGMMTYAAANTASDIFAAFASISGYPINETHLQHNGPRAVPFLHIHGKNDDFVKYSLTPTIIDNMVARNGLSYTPTHNTGSGYDYYAYTGDGKQPYYFYAIDGVGHVSSATIGDKSSREVIWDFFSGKTLNTATSTIEFGPDVNTANMSTSHGWTICNTNSTDEKVIAKYGESGGYTDDGMNVYHSIQLKAGTHHLNFTASNSDPTKHVNVKLIKLGTLDHFSSVNVTGFTVGTEETVNQSYYTEGAISYAFTTDEAAEYQLVFTKESQYDGTTISNVSITTDGTNKGHTALYPVTTAGKTYVLPYRNRLVAQWNFDKCDVNRFNGSTAVSGGKWTEDDANYYDGEGSKTFTYNAAIAGSTTATNVETTYAELTYDGSSIVPITSGLKFNAAADNIKIIVNYAGGSSNGVNLVVNENVKMLVPYVENTYRNDKGESTEPENNQADYVNCLHHMKRDILCTFPKEGTTWQHLNNKCIDANSGGTYNDLFGAGGNELTDDLYFDKLNYMGNDGTPCVMQFTQPISFNRIGVNRNLSYSFYSEFIGDRNMTQPSPRTTIVASPTGQKIANVSGSAVSYDNAIVMTFGGCKSEYSNYDGLTTTDTWAVPSESFDASSIAIDGFTYVSPNTVTPTSESLMPSSTTGNKYHEACNGVFNAPAAKGDGEFQTSTIENYTPWSLPCHGGYLKFEPTIPGVLTVDAYEYTGHDYYIADEFGAAVSAGVFFKSVSADIDTENAHFDVKSNAYVKYMFNVYPGKTYYIFSPTAGIGFAGFYFEPYVYRSKDIENSTDHTSDELGRYDVELKTLTLEKSTDYTYDTNLSSGSRTIESPTTGSANKIYTIYSDNRAVTVTLKRSFEANKWNSICLPFSMNETQVKSVFGEGTRLVLLRDVQDGANMTSKKTTANFIMHENQDILAGYPYFICPTKAVENSFTTNAYIPSKTVDIPTISGLGFKTTTGVGNYGGMETYQFVGSFSNETNIAKGSYYINAKGGLSRTTTGTLSLTPYRAYLKYTGKVTLAKALGAFYFGNTDDDVNGATDVDEISMDDALLQNGILSQKANVYNMQGQVVLQNATNLQNLPKGAYIVNGKKYVVR